MFSRDLNAVSYINDEHAILMSASYESKDYKSVPFPKNALMSPV